VIGAFVPEYRIRSKCSAAIVSFRTGLKINRAELGGRLRPGSHPEPSLGGKCPGLAC
jgi:hypothetical protein